ncbi:hypothetical protein C8Q76DRAFT_738349 [Earliella scabrosa]|nr:hypothetical protein C8Q76DRAFT_738349 [Earliella scabrosa]
MLAPPSNESFPSFSPSPRLIAPRRMRLSLTGLVLPCSLLLLLQATLSLPHVRAAVARTSNSPLADDAHSPPLALAPNPQLTISILPSGAPSDELHSHPSPSLHAVGVPSGRERTPSTDAVRTSPFPPLPRCFPDRCLPRRTSIQPPEG